MRTLLCALAAFALAACGGGTGTELPEKPQIQPDRVELNFGADFQNAVYVDSSLPDTIQIKNGGKQDLVLTSWEMSGTDAAFFKVTGEPKKTIASNTAAFIEVTYSPTAPGSHHATLTIVSNAENKPNLTITMGPSAVWRYKTVGKVTDSGATPKALSGIKVTCVKPKGATCSGDSDCLASGLKCLDQTCQHPKWAGWDVTTGADGAFSHQHSWECGELLASDPAASPAYASNAGPFKADGAEVTIKLDGVYTVKGKVVEKGTATGLSGIKVTCMAPASAPLSWTGWNVTTGGDGTFSSTNVWSCKELYAEDAANTYKPATGVWSTLAAGVTIEMEKN